MLTRSCKNPVNKFVKVKFVKLLILIKRVVVFVVYLSTLKNEFIDKSLCRILMRKQGLVFCETLTSALSGFKTGTHEMSVGFKIQLQRLVSFRKKH